MKDDALVYFFTSEEIYDKANLIFISECKKLKEILPTVDIQHVGSCSIKGAVGKYDVDIQIRVESKKYKEVLEIMNDKYLKKHPELWTEEFSIFSDNKDCPIDYMVTVIDSKYDDFYRVRDYLTENRELLLEYNMLKKKYEGREYGEYRKAKSDFFGGNGKVKFLKY